MITDIYKKYKFEIIAGLFIIVLFFLSRLATLGELPIFTDEAIYIRWAQIAKNDSEWLFISLTDGKQPLFVWFTAIAMRFISDPLIAGRIVSVFAGFATIVGLFFLGKEIFKSRTVGILSGFIYTLYPFALVYDRMALYDSLVGTFTIWGLYSVVLFIKHINLSTAVFVGVLSGIAVLNKSNGFFNLGLLPFSLLLFKWNEKKSLQRLAKWGVLSTLITLITFAIYFILRLSPFFYIIAQKNAVFVYPLSEWIKHPFTYFFQNLFVGQQDWLVRYIGIPFLLLVFYAFFVNKKTVRETLILFIWFLVPFIYLALFGKTLYPRYIFPMTLSLLPLIAYSLISIYQKIKIKYIFIPVFVLAFAYSLWTDYLIIKDFAWSPIPESDKSQYYADWPSGYGIKETINYMKEHEKGNNIALFTQGTFGLMPDAYTIYLYKDSQFTIKGIWPIDDTLPVELSESAKKNPTYIVFYQPCSNCPGKGKAPDAWQLTPALSIKKPAPDTWITLYKVIAE